MARLPHLLPAPVHASERYGDDENAELFSVEAAQIAGAVSTRRAEYATVRRCARIALVGLGYLPSPILRSAQGNPVWPGGVVGSMTHCRGYRAAVVTDESSLRSMGIEAGSAYRVFPFQEYSEAIKARFPHSWVGWTPSRFLALIPIPLLLRITVATPRGRKHATSAGSRLDECCVVSRV